jgi:hypothetical protein
LVLSVQVFLPRFQIGAGGSQYAYFHEEDESSFQLVDTSRFAFQFFKTTILDTGLGDSLSDKDV